MKKSLDQQSYEYDNIPGEDDLGVFLADAIELHCNLEALQKQYPKFNMKNTVDRADLLVGELEDLCPGKRKGREMINGKWHDDRPLLSATAADAEIERLHDIIKAMVKTIEELQEAINQMALNLGPNRKSRSIK